MWRLLNWQPKLIIGLISAIVLIIFVYTAYVYLSGQSEIETLKKELQLQNDATATQNQIAVNKDQTAVNAANFAVNKAANNTNAIIKTDSNKFSSSSDAVENKYCDYMCNQGVLDSGCARWAKEHNRICN